MTKPPPPVQRAIDQRLRELLTGTYFSHIEYDDQWRLKTTGGIWLQAQELQTSFDAEVASALQRHAPHVLLAVDPEVVPTAAGSFRLLRRAVVDARTDASGALTIAFDGGGELRARSDVDIVDWQWSVCGTPSDPYMAYDVACFFTGDVRVKT
jgi:hypothetical protein